VGADPLRPRATERPGSGKPSAASGFAPELVQRNWPIPYDKFVFDPADLDDGPALDSEQKQVLLYFHHHLRRVTYYQLFNIEPAADAASVRTAYFALSKAFHPDRWFRRDLGVFATRVDDIFKWLNRANSVLSSPQKRKGYDNLLRQGYIGEWQLEEKGPKPTSAVPAVPERQKSPPTTANEARKRAAHVFRARAIQAESLAQWTTAIDQYQRALQLDDTSELRIALIECMLRAQRPTTEITAELERARQVAPDNVRLLLLDAEHARLHGAIARASRLYNEALKIDASNPTARQGLDRLSESN
jgi:curved DNA-binding protein CbpA